MISPVVKRLFCRFSTFKLLCILAIICLAFSQVLLGQRFAFDLVAFQGDPSPVGGTFLSFFLRPHVNDADDVLFFSSMIGGPAMSGIFLYSGGKVSPIAVQGQTVPGVPDYKFDSFNDGGINNRGEVAFIANFTDGKNFRTGLFFSSQGETSLLATSGQKPEGLSVPIFFFNGLSVNDLGTIAFSASGNIVLYANGIFSLVANPAGTGFTAYTLPVLNNRGQIAFVAQTTDFRSSLIGIAVRFFSEGKVTTIFSGSGPLRANLNGRGDVAINGCKSGVCGIWSSHADLFSLVESLIQLPIGTPQINNEGVIAYAHGTASSTGLVDRITLVRNGLFTRISDGPAPAPGQGGATFARFGAPSLNNGGTFAFIGSVVLSSGGVENTGIYLARPLPKTYFPHFGFGSSGASSVFSQITLFNLDSDRTANPLVELNDDLGIPMMVNLNDLLVRGRINVMIPPKGAVTLKTDSTGPVQTGSVILTSDVNISGTILFGGSIGQVTVSDSKPLRAFAVPVETGPEVNTGIALMGIGEDQTANLELRNENGDLVARAAVPLRSRAHLSRFVTELPWDNSPDFSKFSGTVTVMGTSEMAAIALHVSPGTLAALPIVEKP